MKDAGGPRYFFDNGLRFACTRCGRCCTGDPGIVFIDRREAAVIARYLSLPLDRFLQTRTRRYRNGYSILEHPDGRCLFFDDGCLIYPVRPTQCRTYPFWFRNLRSETQWQKVAAECPGVGQGAVIGREQILDQVRRTMPRPSRKSGFS